jgi:hypothetical protein
MKCAITGHTSGIGKSLFDYFNSQSYECMGFSRQNGYNITLSSSRQQIISAAIDCEVFVNNAYADGTNSQLDMLQEMHTAWEGKDKLIINISSRITDFVLPPNSHEQQYQKNKKDQDDYCLGKINKPHIFNLKLGMVDTLRVMSYTNNKLTVEDIVKIVSFVLDNRDSYKITTLTAGL